MNRIKFKSVFGALILSLVLVPSLSWALITGPYDAKQVGDRWISSIMERYGSWGGAEEAYILESMELKKEGRLLGYKFSIYPKGHIVVSLLTQLSPVKSYSTRYDFDVESEVGYPDLLKDTMEATLEFLEENYGPLDQLPEEGISPPTNRESWDWLLGYGPRPLGEMGEFTEYAPDWGPLVKSTWGQGDPYNDDCPTGDTSCVTCPNGGSPTLPTLVGCVATAASQIANFWKYPYRGTGSHTWNWPGDDSCNHTPTPQSLSATYSDSYDWDNMLNSYSGGYTATEANAVSELCYEMGVAFDMYYGVCGSGAYTYDAVTVFPTYFKYANTTSRKNRSSYGSAATWFAEIKKEFDNVLPRPIQYRIKGHSILCDGVRPGATDYMHMNYGWYGSSDAWYAVDNLYCPWIGCDYMVEYMVTGIQPLNRMYTYVKGASSSSIYVKYRTYYGYTQSSWQTLSGGTGCSPAVAVFNSRQYMAVKGASSNQIYINSRGKWFDWGAWTPISGATSCSPALTVYNNRLYMAVRGATTNNIYYRYMDTSGTWSGWYTLSGATSDSPALVTFNDRLYLFIKGATSNTIYFRYLSGDGSWSGWYYFASGATSHAPSGVVYDDKLYLFVKGASSNAIYYAYQTTSGTWYGWFNVPGGTSCSPNVTVMPQTGSMSLAVKGASSNSIYYQTYTSIDGWAGAWTRIPGGTSDTPVQCTHYYADPWESAPDADLMVPADLAEASGPDEVYE